MINPERILIVDDIEENLRVLTETLTVEGFKTLQAKSGERALQIAEKALPDLILLDIQMPGLNGYETIKKLKENKKTREIPVIFISALNQVEDKVKGFQVGGVDYISKPFQKEEVVARVETHIKLRNTQRKLAEEKEKSEKLLLNILPASVAEELKNHGKSEPQNFNDVTVFFSDIVGFTDCAGNMEPKELIEELNELFTAFDEIMEKNSCERIKTIGDAYLAVCGMPEASPDHAKKIIQASIEIIEWLKKRKSEKHCWQVRIGIHSGPVVGGIVGTKKYIYDVFGDTINTASRMELYSESMEINVSETTFNLTKDHFQFTPREALEVKGKGLMKMYFIKS